MVAGVEVRQALIFYDGTCGLCHRAVQFALRHDEDGARFRFAPLQGGTYRALVGHSESEDIPDSFMILTAEGERLERSDAVVRMLERIGGVWGFWGRVMSVVPRALRDAGYRGVAAVRYRIFGRKDELCPVMRPDERRRFDP